MRQLLPEPAGDLDPYDAARIEDPGAALVRLNFVTSLDGSITDERGRSGGLGGAGDRAMFRALRAWADAILVGAGTARAEGYGPHRLRPDLAVRRAADGRPEPAPVVVVTRSLGLDFASALFTAARRPTIVLTCAAAPADLRRQANLLLPGRVLVAGEDEVDLALGLARLRDQGLASILCEGGPRLAEGLLGAGLVDELCLTLAPTLIGHAGPSLVASLPARLDLDLVRLYAEGSELYTRYRPPR